MPPRQTNSSSGGERASALATLVATENGAVDVPPQPPAQHGPSDRDSAASVSFADIFTPSPQEPLEYIEVSDASARANEEPQQDNVTAMLDPPHSQPLCSQNFLLKIIPPLMTTLSGGELILSSVIYCRAIAHVGRASTRLCLSRRFPRTFKPLPSRDTRVSFNSIWSLAFFQLHLCFMHAVCQFSLALHAASISAIFLRTAFMHSQSSALLSAFVLLCSLSSALLSPGGHSEMNFHSFNLLLIQPIFGFAAFVVHLPEHLFVQADHEECSVHTIVTTASVLFLSYNLAPVCYACSLSKSLAIFLCYLALCPQVPRANFLAWHSTLPSPFCLQRLRLPFPSSLAFAVPFSVVYFGLRTSFYNLAVLCPSASFKFCIDLCLFYLSTKSIRPCLNNKINHKTKLVGRNYELKHRNPKAKRDDGECVGGVKMMKRF